MTHLRSCIFYAILNLCLLSPALAQAQNSLSELEKIDYYIELHEKDQTNTDYIMAVAMAYKNKHMFPQALSYLEKTLAIDNKHEEALFQTGVILSWTQKFDSALSYFDQLLLLNPEHADGLMAKARVLSWKDKRLEALELIDKVLNIAPEYADAYVLKGKILTWQKEYDAATAMYTKALSLAPDNKDAKRAIPDIESFKGNYEPAIAGYEQLLAEYPGDINLLNGLGKILSWKGDYERAIETLNKALKLEPLRADTLWLLSRSYRWAQRFDEGIVLQKKILERDPDNFQATKDIGQLYEESGRDNEAIVWFNKALEINPDSPDINARLGMIYSRTNQINQAVREFERATRIENNDDVTNLITLGRLFSWKSRLSESVKQYKKALELNPQSEDAYIGLGRTYFYDNKLELALEQMRHALKLNPLNKEADYEYKRIAAFLRPTIASRYNYLFYRDYAENNYITKTHRHEFVQELTWPLSSKLTTQIQYRSINDSRFEDNSGNKDYTIEGDEYAFYAHKTLSGYFSTKAKVVAGKYSLDSSEYSLRDDSFVSGFGIIDFEYERIYTNLIYSREALYPILRGPDMYIKYLNSYGGSLRYELNAMLSVFGAYYCKDYYDAYTRDEYLAGLSLIVPRFEELELEYYFKHITDPDDRLHTGEIKYRDRIGALSFLLSYALESSSLFDELTQEIRFFAYTTISNRHGLNIDLSYAEELRNNKDIEAKAQAYVSYRL